jgi:hypothetical protein
MATFDELREQAELEIKGQDRSFASDDTDCVEQAADLLPALQLWADAQDRTEEDVREVVEAAGGTI